MLKIRPLPLAEFDRRPGLHTERFFDSQSDSVARRCLSSGTDAEAMRIAVVVRKEKLGLSVVSVFEF